MSDRQKKMINKTARAIRTRSTVHGTSERPRLTVTISNMHVSAQIINDEEHKTLVAVTSAGSKMTGTMTEKAAKVGEEIAKLAVKNKITAVAFDRGAKRYHGRVKALAEAARKNGLGF